MKQKDIQNKIQGFLDNPDNLKKMFFGIGGVVLIGLLVYGYIFYQESQDKALAIKVNEAQDAQQKLEQNKLLENFDQKKYETDLAKLGEDLNQIYMDNSGLVNGLRALYLSAGIDLKLKQFSAAGDKYQALVDGDKGHYLAPMAYYHLVIINENSQNYQGVIDLVQNFQVLYPGHFLEGEMLMALGRNYYFLGQSGEADRIFQEILQDQNLQGYYESVQDWQNLIGVEKKISGTTP